MTKDKDVQRTAARAIRDRASLQRKVGMTFGRGAPKDMTRAVLDNAVGEFIDEAERAVSNFIALKPIGKPLPAATIALLRKISLNAERWQRQLERSRPPISLPLLTALRIDASRKVSLYTRRRGKSGDSARHGLVSDLYDAYTTACPWGRRGFQPAANAVMTNAGLPIITKHEMAKLQAQMAEFAAFDVSTR